MTLYHGTNADVESIDLAKGIRIRTLDRAFT
jgi:hypothetical protein